MRRSRVALGVLAGIAMWVQSSLAADVPEAPPEPATIGILAFDDVLTSEVTAPMEVFGAAASKEWFAHYRILLVSATEARWLASNCSGAFLLAHAGLLDGVEATTWAGGEAQLAAEYPAVEVQVDRNVVIDGRVITSNGGVVSYEAALALLAELSTPEHAREIADMLQFSRVQSRP